MCSNELFLYKHESLKIQHTFFIYCIEFRLQLEVRVNLYIFDLYLIYVAQLLSIKTNHANIEIGFVDFLSR